jgi:hypothetical protein
LGAFFFFSRISNKTQNIERRVPTVSEDSQVSEILGINMLSERLIPDMPFDVAWALDALGQRMGDDVLATAIAPLLKNEEVDPKMKFI